MDLLAHCRITVDRTAMDRAVGDAGRSVDPMSWRRPSEWCEAVKDVC